MPSMFDLGRNKGEAAPGHLLPLITTDLGGTSTNAAETTILSAGAISSLFPRATSVGDMFHIRAGGTWVNSSGSNQTLTLNLYIGSTQVATNVSTSLSSAASTRKWMLDIYLAYTVLGGAGAGKVRTVGVFDLASGGGAGYVSPGAVSAIQWNGYEEFTLANNVDSSGDLKAVMSSGTSNTVICGLFICEYYPKSF